VIFADGGKGFELSFCLATRADDGGGAGVLTGEIFGGDSGSGTGA